MHDRVCQVAVCKHFVRLALVLVFGLFIAWTHVASAYAEGPICGTFGNGVDPRGVNLQVFYIQACDSGMVYEVAFDWGCPRGQMDYQTGRCKVPAMQPDDDSIYLLQNPMVTSRDPLPVLGLWNQEWSVTQQITSIAGFTVLANCGQCPVAAPTPPTTPPTAVPLINAAKWLADVTVPDGATFAPNARFIKTWRVQNNGTTTWGSGYQLAFLSGDPMGSPAAVNLTRAVKPGEQIDLSVPLNAPAKPGTYRGVFQLRNAQGTFFGSKLLVVINVFVPIAASTPKPTTPPLRSTATPLGQPPIPTGTLKPGDGAITTGATRLRVGPSIKWGELQTVGADTRMRILNGPVVADGYTWYSVSLSDNDSYAGWCADRSLRRETFDSRQIRFNVRSGTFTRLKIVGQNQYGDTTVWEKKFAMGQTVADTKDFWWRETLTLEFDVLNLGTRQCVIDSLHLTTTDQYQPVTYIGGQGCTGDDGSARSHRNYVEQLDEALSFAEASEITSILEKTDAGLGCLEKIAQGVSSKLKVIALTVSCGSVAIDRVREILEENHITIQILKGPINYSLYCRDRYGAGAYAAYKDSRDAGSWVCILGSKEAGVLDMDAACRLTSPSRPKAVMGDQWQAASWYCTP